MWDELQRLHAALLDVIKEHEQLCAASKPDRNAVASSRWRVAATGRKRLAFLNEVVFPLLERHSAAAERKLAEALRDQTPAYQRRISTYVSHWSTDAIMANWPRYQKEAKAFREEILDRIQLETDILRPVLRGMVLHHRTEAK